MAVVVTRPLITLMAAGFAVAAPAAGVSDPTEPPPNTADIDALREHIPDLTTFAEWARIMHEVGFFERTKATAQA